MRRALFLALLAVAGIGASQAVPPGFKIDIDRLVEGPAHAGSSVRLALKVTLAEGFHVQSNQPRDATLIPTVLAIDPPAGATAVEAVFPRAIDFKLEGSPEPLAVFEREFVIGARLQIDALQPPGDLVIPARLRYQACDDKQCFRPMTADVSWTVRVVPKAERGSAQHSDVFKQIAFGRGLPPPRTAPGATATPAAKDTIRPTSTAARDAVALMDRFTILDSEGGYMDVPAFLELLRNAESGTKRRGWFEDRGPLAILAIVFAGGLALNLTPCVLPMIPINLAIIGAGSQAGRKRRGFLLGATYGGAMAVVYGVLGLIVILTAGTFGTINASPWFNVAIAALFVVLGLAMFDVLTLDFSRLSSRITFAQESRGTFFLAFGMGAIAALLAGACVAPVVIQVVVFASNLYAGGSSIALALPFFLGLGMALPWPIAGAGLASLPKPGAWMVRVKQAMGIFILATAAYYGYVAYGLFANRWVDPNSVTAGVEEKLKDGWYSSLADGLEAAERENRPVLIDFWATWCKNCFVMDKTTLADPVVEAALSKYVRIKFQAEDLDAYPASELLQRVGGFGLPTYAILKPKQ
ncbi:MAG TPA: cytochrome c biogenesis protein CcdA [Vicinamibacterales bacterium]|nr:cytochrome c biogenesis protein CcdA [Vicinamibacterales bacterium]